MAIVIYLLDRNPFKNYNVYVSSSQGLFDKSSFKENLRNEWSDEHGFDIDLSKRYKESKIIVLDCFIPATTIQECILNYNNFLNEIDKPKSRRLSVIADTLRMEYQVFRTESTESKLEYDDTLKVGSFKLRLVENMPVKKVLKADNQSTSITINSSKILVINWGDGSEQYTRPGEGTYTKSYASFTVDKYFPLVLGDIDSIANFNSNCTVLWNKF